MPLNYVTTKGPNPKLKRRNQDFDQIKKEENIPLGVNEEGNEDIDKEDIEEFELVHPNSEVTKEDSRTYRLDKQASQVWTWSEPFTFT